MFNHLCYNILFSGHRNPSFRVWNLKAMKPILYDSNRTFSENEARESEKDSSVAVRLNFIYGTGIHCCITGIKGHRNPSFRVWNLKAMKPILYDSNRTFSENEARESEKDSSVVAVKIRGHGLALPEELMKIFFLASVEFIRTFDPLLQHKADKECNPFRAKSRELKTAHPENKAP
ncbi:hypothetical protein F2Q69_00041130 [Brassica cretica]|uniref:Uncharacterized protein n=1 Tax=Brassica cretica TaxID=69181 RepID=A0A8S9NHM4_BRACR|nr:hypothetical protein F2Q69_00041130 [Brassica cretica]